MKENAKAPLIVNGMPMYIITTVFADADWECGEYPMEETFLWIDGPEALFSKIVELHKPALRSDALCSILQKVKTITCYAIDEDCDRTEKWTMTGDEFRKLLKV